jgi:MFS family permease
MAGQAFAAAVIGLSIGSELDVVTYLATRHFGLKRFGVLFGAMITALALGTAFGPVAAGLVFDITGSYRFFLSAAIPLMVFGSIALLLLGRYPDFRLEHQPPGARSA